MPAAEVRLRFTSYRPGLGDVDDSPMAEDEITPDFVMVQHGHRLLSANWDGLERLNSKPDSFVSRRVQNTLLRINLEALSNLATSLREGQECRISDQFTFGTENLVREIVFDDGVLWIARFSFAFVSPQLIESEVVTMRFVKQNTKIPVPDVYAYDGCHDNSLGGQYIIMEALMGRKQCRALDPRMLDIPDDKKAMVCEQLTDYFLQLNSLRFPVLGSLQLNQEGSIVLGEIYRTDGNFPSCKEPSQYYLSVARAALRRCFDPRIRNFRGEFLDAWLQLLIAKKPDQTAASNYPLAHPDFYAHNILFDNDFNIVGILDWSYAHTVPIELFCCVPGGSFVMSEQEMLRVFEEFRAQVQAEEDEGLKLRKIFLSGLREQERQRKLDPPLSQFFDTDNVSARHALMFNEYYNPHTHTLFEEAFDTPATTQNVADFAESLFRQDIPKLMREAHAFE